MWTNYTTETLSTSWHQFVFLTVRSSDAIKPNENWFLYINVSVSQRVGVQYSPFRTLSASLCSLTSVRAAGIDRYNLVRANIHLLFKFSLLQSMPYLRCLLYPQYILLLLLAVPRFILLKLTEWGCRPHFVARLTFFTIIPNFHIFFAMLLLFVPSILNFRRSVCLQERWV